MIKPKKIFILIDKLFFCSKIIESNNIIYGNAKCTKSEQL